MQEQKSRRQLRRVISGFLVAALVVSTVPGQVTVSAKTKGKTAKKICLSAPASAKDKKVKTSLYLKKGSRFKIKSKVTPASAGKKMVYKSSKKRIAAVSQKGQIVAKKCGKTRITVRPGKNAKVSATIQVTVVKKLKKVKKIKINATKLSITAGSKKQLKAKVVSPKKPTTKKFNWFSSNKTVASVSKKGVVTAKKAGTAKITVTSADGRGAKAVCTVTVTKGSQNQTPAASQTPKSTLDIKGSPTPTATATTAPDEDVTLAVVVPGERSGVKQGEELQLTAKDSKTDTVLTTGITWSVNELTGVSLSKDGLLTVAKDASAGEKITVTATADSGEKSSDSVTLTIVENQTVELSENMIQLNQSTDDQPLGLTYRSKEAYSTVSDPERGDVIRFDASKGYTSNSYDVLAWMTVDPMYAGKTVTISAYLKYDKVPDVEAMNLVINERWGCSNPAVKWNALPDNWYFITGTYTLPSYTETRYSGDTNKIYICRDGSNLADNVNAVYYIDDLMITVEKADVENVNLSAAGAVSAIYQNHTLQFSAEVTGTNVPIQKVEYTIEPAVEGASISEDGLLTVGNVAAGTEINVKAASLEDPTKSDTKTITVLAQSIDSIAITAEGSPDVIYQNNELQFSAEITSSGDPDESVEWSISPAVEGASISKNGLLQVGDVADGTEICVKAASVFDPAQSVSYNLTVRENKVNSVSVSTAGDKTTISSDLPLNLSAKVDVTGTPSTAVTWSIVPEVSGVSLEPNGNSATLSVDSTVADGVQITVKAVSQFDSSKAGEVTITVSNASSEEFDLNKLSVQYFEDFNDTTLNEISGDKYISYQCSNPYSDDSYMTSSNLDNSVDYRYGILNTGDGLTLIQQLSKAFRGYFGDAENDYVQFALKNDSDAEKTYTLSFFFLFAGSPIDENWGYTSYTDIDYKLPLKLVSCGGDEEVVLTTVEASLPCYGAASLMYNKEYHEVIASVTVPAGKTANLQLKMNGDLPLCYSETHNGKSEEGYSNTPHPVQFYIDNVAISTGANPVIEVKKEETYQLSLDTLESDTVTYQTNSYLAVYTHTNKPSTECSHGYNPDVATVDENGVITANKAGETCLIATITHEDGSIERKQCIVRVTE